MIKYGCRLVYKDERGARHVCEFSQASWRAIMRVLQYLQFKKYDLIFITIADNEQQSVLKAPKNLLTFYDLDEAINILVNRIEYVELSDVFKAVFADYLRTHEVQL